MEIYTLGFAKKSAEEFFGLLKNAGIKGLVDVRLSNTSQLAGFTKRDDLAYFLREICGIGYVHEPRLAPTKEILDGYKKKKITWEDYERRFLVLMGERNVAQAISRSLFDGPTVLLCSEVKPDRCHRRLVAEFLKDAWQDASILHL
ncbi:MAG: DUF488 domain-containing protein [Planctomycetota bacterium]